MERLDFTITLYSRCRIGASFGRDGRDVTVDHDEPIHGDHIKGLMRAEARLLKARGHLAETHASLVDEVFGTPSAPSPWTWTPADVLPGTGGWDFADRHRVKVDRESRAARKDHLVRGETVWAEQAKFAVIWLGYQDPPSSHEALLTVAAASVHHLGSWRRRGLGWVGIASNGRTVADDLRALRGQS